MINILRVERARHNITMEELAIKVGVTRQTIHAIETNKNSPSLLIATRISWLFGKRIDEIFRMEEEEKTSWESWERLDF